MDTFSLLTCPEIGVLFSGYFRAVVPSTKYMYLYTAAKSRYLCVNQQKKKNP